MDGREITCRNEDGYSLSFGEVFAPFLLVNCEGIYECQNSVTVSDNTMTDGGTYQGSNVKVRNIILTLKIKENHLENRQKLYRLFKAKTPGTFIYKEAETERQIQYYVENINNSSTGNTRTSIISLICPDPFFESVSDITVEIANWESLFEFAFEIPEEGIVFGMKSESKSGTIENDSGAENTGVRIEITADGEVVNPIIYHTESGEFIRIGTETKPIKMVTGDKVIITTGTNNKHVYLEKDGAGSKINGYLDIASEFIQLMSGKNTFAYSADSGEENMNIKISFRYKYLGV